MKKIKHNCIEYPINDNFSIWEIKNDHTYDYFVCYNTTVLSFSFGIFHKDRFDYDSLLDLWRTGYFDSQIQDIFKRIKDADDELSRLMEV